MPSAEQCRTRGQGPGLPAAIPARGSGLILAAAPSARAGMRRRSFLGAEYLTQHFEQARCRSSPYRLTALVPAIPGWVPPSTGGQRLNLPARAFGVGTNLTLPYARHEDEPLEVLELPDDALTMGLPPLGNPAPGRRAQPADPW
jgi:hypothetical protein